MADSNLKPWSQVCIKLLQGPLFRQNVNDKLWEKLEMYESDIQAFFAILGVSVAIDKADGFAFLQQNDLNEEDDNVSRLIRQISLTEEQSFLCILLRDELNKFDNPNNSQNKSSVLILRESELYEQFAMFYTSKTDQITARNNFKKNLNRLCELGLLKEQNPDDMEKESEYEVRRYVRAKIDSKFCEEFMRKLKERETDNE
ncbi:hypothetical protein HNP77_002246 [Treponema rectale]|uniref:DUF4194 domain-containing protein n=1 Tax=Treponema rectale TaxID=744512 RepID=A0A840SDK8_9SPIR|nr:DUF4194 domain-containing protein [Treponema rectale]MBB5219857.1 hypothetical protein [Treponema rectale]